MEAALLISLILIGCLELIVSISIFWRWRKPLAVLTGLLLFLNFIWLLLYGFNRFWIDLILLIVLYRLFNIWRLGFTLLQPEYLRHLFRRTTIRLLMVQIVIMGIGLVTDHYRFVTEWSWSILAVLQLVFACILLTSTLRHFRASKRINLYKQTDEHQLPTLSVAIPARNETESLNQCLMSLIACDYPKLEILVLDDCSTTKRTPEIIRAFAQDGVVFISGQEPPHGWLAKNYAYEQLLQAANGDVVMFCGADIRFERDSLKFLVTSLLTRHKAVESIVPKSRSGEGLLGKVLQPLRYTWEISLPRRYLRRPPVLSSCWLAERQFLLSNGGFKAVTGSVIAEAYFAREATRQDGYSFFRYDGIASAKTAAEQLETAIRLRYPQLRHQPETVMAVSLVELLILATPVIIIAAAISQAWLIVALSLLSLLIYAYIFGSMIKLTYRQKLSMMYWMWPLALVIDLWLMHLSMYRYESGRVYWRGRLVDRRG